MQDNKLEEVDGGLLDIDLLFWPKKEEEQFSGQNKHKIQEKRQEDRTNTQTFPFPGKNPTREEVISLKNGDSPEKESRGPHPENKEKPKEVMKRLQNIFSYSFIFFLIFSFLK